MHCHRPFQDTLGTLHSTQYTTLYTVHSTQYTTLYSKVVEHVFEHVLTAWL